MNWPARSLIRNLTVATRCPRSIRRLRAACVVQEPSGFAVMPPRMNAAGAVLDDDQGVEAPQEHSIHVDEIGREDAAGLDGQELLPRRARTARCGVDPASCRICQTVEAAMGWPSLTSSPCTRRCPQARIVDGHADNELADRGCRARPSGTPTGRVVPSACDQLSVPGEQRRRGHREHLAPSAPGDQPGQGRKPQPVARLVADPADLTAQDRVLCRSTRSSASLDTSRRASTIRQPSRRRASR